jgi:hypothetical protein
MAEPSKTETRILKSRSDYPAYCLRGMVTVLVSTSRNLVSGERYDSRTYELPSGRRIVVKTLCQMEVEDDGC